MWELLFEKPDLVFPQPQRLFGLRTEITNWGPIYLADDLELRLVCMVFAVLLFWRNPHEIVNVERSGPFLVPDEHAASFRAALLVQTDVVVYFGPQPRKERIRDLDADRRPWESPGILRKGWWLLRVPGCSWQSPPPPLSLKRVGQNFNRYIYQCVS